MGTRAHRLSRPLVVGVLVFGISLIASQIIAISGVKSIEGESTNKTGGAVTVSDSGASGGQSVRLGLAGATSTPSVTSGTTATPTNPPSGGQIQYISSSIVQSTKGVANVTLQVPSGYQAGDLLLAMMQSDYGMISVAPPGWTRVEPGVNEYDLSAFAYWKFATANEPSTGYLFDLAGEDFRAIAGGTMMAFRGVNTTNPLQLVAAATSTSPAKHAVINSETSLEDQINCPSIQSPVNGMLVCMFTLDDHAPITPRTPLVLVPNSSFSIPINYASFDDSHAVGYQRILTGGATGLRYGDMNNSKDGNDIGLAVVLLPQ